MAIIKQRYEVEYVTFDGKIILEQKKFATRKDCYAFIKKLRRELFIKIAQILTINKPNEFQLYKFSRN